MKSKTFSTILYTHLAFFVHLYIDVTFPLHSRNIYHFFHSPTPAPAVSAASSLRLPIRFPLNLSNAPPIHIKQNRPAAHPYFSSFLTVSAFLPVSAFPSPHPYSPEFSPENPPKTVYPRRVSFFVSGIVSF